jgi:hypothetical protein
LPDVKVVSAAGTLFGEFTDREETHRFAHGVAGTTGVRLPVTVAGPGVDPYRVWPDCCEARVGQRCYVDRPLPAGSLLISQFLVWEDRSALPAL